MIKKRIIATVIVKDGIAVQSINFSKWLPLGKPSIAVDFFNDWGADEIILLDISATAAKKHISENLVREVAGKCNIPLTVGGGISSVEQIKKLLGSGADKVSLNQSAFNNISFIKKASEIFGNQCIVVSLDVLTDISGGHHIYNHLTKQTEKKDIFLYCTELQKTGAGELFITSVNRDGSGKGFEIELIKKISQHLQIPVIASGGAGNASDFTALFKETNASGGSAANFFHFNEHAITIVKNRLMKEKINIRLETNFNYSENPLNNDFRLIKKKDSVLEAMRFIKIEKEII